MEIIVDGWRAGDIERKEAKSVPASQLPPLSEEQKKVARKMGIPEEDYARSAHAGRLNQGRLIEKTKRFARLLQKKLQERGGVEITEIRLDVLRHRYEVAASAGERPVAFLVSEELIDDLFQTGSESLERDLERVLEYALPAHAV